MLTTEEMTKRIGEREAAVLRDKMHSRAETTTASVVTDMSTRIAQHEAGLVASAAAYDKTQERLREVRGF